ncbi:MAG: dihydrofolate reductase [Aeromicrobium sp.]
MTVSLVVAMGSNGVIGVDDDMPWHLPEDLAHFKEVTLGHPMIMGRRTFEAIGRVLPGRTTIVVTHQQSWGADDVETALDFDEALAKARDLDDTIFVVGGAQIYDEALKRGVVDTLIVTRIEAAPDGDTYFPSIEWSEWTETGREEFPESDPDFSIITYQHN